MIIKKILNRFKPGCGAAGEGAESAAPRALRLAAGAALIAVAQLAAAAPYDKDLAGAKDHPVISRYQGSVLVMKGEAPVSRIDAVFDDKGKPVRRPVEGKVANFYYVGPTGTGALEVYRNFKTALEGDGFEILYACETARCEEVRTQSQIQSMAEDAAWQENRRTVQGIFNSGNQPNFHFVSAKKATAAGPVHVQVGVVTGRPGSDTGTRTRQFIQVIEPAVAATGKVTVNAKAIQDGLERDGKVVFYGVLFDTNKAVIKDESAGQLAEMAGALKAASGLKAYVVGHTDNQGELASNMTLSQKRAQAVVDALSGKYGIAANRLVARGVASLAPVASNRDESGRAKNRRVELILQ